jgi:hypothetical protein
MIGFLFSPLGKYVAMAGLAIALAIGCMLFLAHVREQGRIEERASEAVAAQLHENAVLRNSRDADAEAARQADPQGALKKDWEKPQ